jgi:hypothetical protein
MAFLKRINARFCATEHSLRNKLELNKLHSVSGIGRFSRIRLKAHRKAAAAGNTTVIPISAVSGHFLSAVRETLTVHLGKETGVVAGFWACSSTRKFGAGESWEFDRVSRLPGFSDLLFRSRGRRSRGDRFL